MSPQITGERILSVHWGRQPMRRRCGRAVDAPKCDESPLHFATVLEASDGSRVLIPVRRPCRSRESSVVSTSANGHWCPCRRTNQIHLQCRYPRHQFGAAFISANVQLRTIVGEVATDDLLITNQGACSGVAVEGAQREAQGGKRCRPTPACGGLPPESPARDGLLAAAAAPAPKLGRTFARFTAREQINRFWIRVMQIGIQPISASGAKP